jgi:hypothetical protein
MMLYRSTITIGGLKLAESRIVADLLLRGIKSDEWRDAIEHKNVLQSRSPVSAKNTARLVRERLKTLDAGAWRMVREGKGAIPIQVVFACALKHSRLLKDFMVLAVADHYRLFSTTLPSAIWAKFLEGCRERDPDMPLWTEATRRRLRSSVFQCLAQAGYISSTKECRLQKVHLAPQVIAYLKNRHEDDVLQAMQVGP